MQAGIHGCLFSIIGVKTSMSEPGSFPARDSSATHFFVLRTFFFQLRFFCACAVLIRDPVLLAGPSACDLLVQCRCVPHPLNRLPYEA